MLPPVICQFYHKHPIIRRQTVPRPQHINLIKQCTVIFIIFFAQLVFQLFFEAHHTIIDNR